MFDLVLIDYINLLRRELQIWKLKRRARGAARRIRSLALATAVPVLLLGAGYAQPARAADAGGLARFLIITDIHFDPFYDGKLMHRLQARATRDWPAILGSGAGGFSSYGEDSNYRLLRSALADARAREPRPDFILYPGDFLAHHWRDRFDELARGGGEAAYRRFTNKVVQFLAERFARYFPNVPVLPTLGNDDAYCGDYQIEPNGPFLKMFAETWRPLLGRVPVDQTDFETAFSTGGYFSMPLPRLEKHRLIVLNTVLFSSRYTNRCGDASRNPGREQLEWLERTLAQAELQRETVWLLMHIPFGVNVFATLSRGAAGKPVMFWHREYTQPFFDSMRRHSRRVQAIFSGHVHMDTFRILTGPDNRALVFDHIAPAVSPIFGNNPGYQIFDYSRSTGELANYATVYLTNLRDTSRAGARGIWEREYRFDRAYGLEGVNRTTLQTLARQVARNPDVRRKYARYYNVSHTQKSSISNGNVKAYGCALDNPTAQSFDRCRQE